MCALRHDGEATVSCPFLELLHFRCEKFNRKGGKARDGGVGYLWVGHVVYHGE